MARPRKPFEETARGEIYGELCDYATTHNVIPGAHSFWSNVMRRQRGYSMSWSAFRWHWDQLQKDGMIEIDRNTGAPNVKALKVTET